MKRILFIPSDNKSGVYYYRCYCPMKCLSENYGNEFDITIDNHWCFNDAEKDEIGKNFDIVIFHQCLYISKLQDEIWKMIIYCKKEYDTKFVLDIDDYWDYGEKHPSYNVCLFNAFPEKMMINFKLFDYVTTTTEYFKSVISNYFPIERIFVFENGISLFDKQFSTFKNESDKLRIGLTGGASHVEDIKQMMDMSNYMTDKQLEQIEFVLCGYDNKNAKKITIDDSGNVVNNEKLKDSENWWVNTEKHFKMKFRNYRRIETKDIMKGEFGKIYENIDILLAPLNNNNFNRCKSELKIIEAGFTGTAVIASNVIPYNNYGSNKYDCLLVKKNTPEEWARAVKLLMNDKELLANISSENMIRCRSLRNLESITDKRAEFFRNI